MELSLADLATELDRLAKDAVSALPPNAQNASPNVLRSAAERVRALLGIEQRIESVLSGQLDSTFPSEHTHDVAHFILTGEKSS